MNGWGKIAGRVRVSPEWNPFEELPAGRSSVVVADPQPSVFADDLLTEIDGLLSHQDFLIGYWQAPGE